jgi:cytochrome c-type biogenesis protein CcmE
MHTSASHSRWSRSARVRGVAVAVAVLVGVTVLAVSGFEGTLTYYRTPTEVRHDPPPSGERFRMGGMVVRGSVADTARGVRFVLTDGTSDLTVVSSSSPPRTFRTGQGAVVEGKLVSDRLFRADRVIVRHSNEYRPADRPR